MVPVDQHGFRIDVRMIAKVIELDRVELEPRAQLINKIPDAPPVVHDSAAFFPVPCKRLRSLEPCCVLR